MLPVVVAREPELGQLDAALAQALTGQGQVRFVAGEAGSGKSTLVAAFVQQAQAQHMDLIAATGQADAQTGAGDAYLPFRELLALLTGDVDARVVRQQLSQEQASRLRRFLTVSGETLLEVGPNLIDIFVPGSGLLMRAGTFAAKKVGWIERLRVWVERPRAPTPGAAGVTQDQIFEQYTNVLCALAQKQPLLLVLDDLHWADAASISLLFRLGRRIGASRILLIGTYRPDDVALGRAGARHPLDSVLSELQRYLGNITLDLDLARAERGRAFIDALIDSEPNQLDEAFRSALFHHTGGHALFSTELLRDLQERGELAQDTEGRWRMAAALDWDTLPARVEGVIAERVARLAEELRRALTIGSVEGEQFTAEVVARVQAVEVRGLVRTLSGALEQQHRLVHAVGLERVAGQRLARYSFRHNLFQRYLYNELDPVEQAYLHEDVGTALEALYGAEAGRIAVQLVHHFTVADLPERVRPYLRLAGEQAAARYAHAEALAYLGQALEVTPESDATERYALLLAREWVENMQGPRDAQAHDLTALEQLADALDDTTRRAEVAVRRAEYAELTGAPDDAIAAARQAVALAEAAETPTLAVRAYTVWASTLWRQSNHDAARTLAEQSLELARAVGDRAGACEALTILGGVTCIQGDYVAARSASEQSLVLAQELGDRRSEWQAFAALGRIALYQGDYAVARTYYEQQLRLCRDIGDRLGEGLALDDLGAVALCYGDFAAAQANFTQALVLYQATGDQQSWTSWTLRLAALAKHLQGDDATAAAQAQAALQLARENDDQSEQGLALLTLGHALAGLGRLDEAAAAYAQAHELLQRGSIDPLLPEALAGLARVALAQDDRAGALAHVAPILAHLASGGTLDSALEPLRVYLTCYQVLQAVSDARAAGILTTAYALLQERAAKIPDTATRRMFLENVPYHRKIVAAWEAKER